MDLARYSALLTRRATLTRQWELFFAEYPVLLLPVSAELFPDQLDLAGEAYARVWRAQMPQIGVPFMGFCPVRGQGVPGAKGTIPVGVQLMAGRYREDLCLAAGEAIEAAGQPIDIAEPEA